MHNSSSSKDLQTWQEQPITSNDTEAGKVKNRRLELAVMKKRKETSMKQERFARVGFAFLTATGLAIAGLGLGSCDNRSAEQTGKKIDEAVGAAKEKAAAATEAAKQTAGQAAEAAKSAASAASETAEQTVEATKQKMGEGMEAVKETAKQATVATVEAAGNAAQAAGDAAKAAGDAAKTKADETKEKLQ